MVASKEMDKTQADEPDTTSIRLTQRNGSAASWPSPPPDFPAPPPPIVPDAAPTLDDVNGTVLGPVFAHEPQHEPIPETLRDAEIDLDLETAPTTVRSGSGFWSDDEENLDDNGLDGSQVDSGWDADSATGATINSSMIGSSITSSGVVSAAVGSGTVPIPPIPNTSSNPPIAPTVMDAPLKTRMIRPISRERRPDECHYDWRAAEKRPAEKKAPPPATALAMTTAPAPRPGSVPPPAATAPVLPGSVPPPAATAPVLPGSVPPPAITAPAIVVGVPSTPPINLNATAPATDVNAINAVNANAQPNAQPNRANINDRTIVLRPMLAASTGPFDVEVIENVPAHTRYRDAVRLGDHDALLVMTDFVNSPALTPAQLSRWKRVVRQAGSRGDSPSAVLQILNRELAEVGLQATATCARLDVRENLINVACAGAEPPFVLRSDQRSVRVVQTAPSVALGRLVSAQFAERSLHFERGDTLLLPSAAWVTDLEGLLAKPVMIDPTKTRASEWLRQQWGQPNTHGALLCLTLR